MTYQVTIQPSGHSYSCEDDESILNAALREGFNLPYGCRNGACGSCKGKLLSGDVEHHGSATALSDADRSAGKILFCVAHPLGDISIECREIGAARDIQIRTMPCRVQRLEKLASDVMLVQLRLPASERLQFLPGQYIDILLRDGQRRSFSIANPPHDDSLTQLHIRHVPGGLFTDQVFSSLKEKDILRIEGPHGNFFLREDSAKPVLFVAGGTGFAPVQSMLAHAIQHRHDRQFTLYWGARNRAGLYLDQTARRWADEQPNITYVPVLSDASPDDAWQGRTGLVTEALAADLADLSGYQVYACGAPAMVEATRTLCLSRGLPDDEFYSDAFSFQSGG